MRKGLSKELFMMLAGSIFFFSFGNTIVSAKGDVGIRPIYPKEEVRIHPVIHGKKHKFCRLPPRKKKCIFTYR
ncbi:hypothetical protein [Paenibacillus elgii]|uniref:hypothetical protein n=1 Tax=Paenibacillus elgii TaxID=189691 RepID=UPI00203F986E|nr:hypothetical protein [Paenibacillus elgii]MCM3271837.1 hypothetical protein [Paenibacillus elgii]